MIPNRSPLDPKILLALGILIAALSLGTAQADELYASDQELQEARAGLMLPNGVMIDFSWERSVAINGVERYASAFSLPKDFSLDRLRPSPIGINANNIAPSESLAPNMSFIRNTLDNQLISNLTNINITVSHLRNLDLSNLTNISTAWNNPLLR